GIERITIPHDRTEVLECEVADPSQVPACRRHVEYRKLDEIAIKTKPSGPSSLATGYLFLIDVPTSIAECANPASPFCYSLGSKSAALLLPLIGLYEPAKTSNQKLISKQQILDKYNLDPKVDECSRSDITIREDGQLDNDSSLTADQQCVA